MSCVGQTGCGGAVVSARDGEPKTPDRSTTNPCSQALSREPPGDIEYTAGVAFKGRQYSEANLHKGAGEATAPSKNLAEGWAGQRRAWASSDTAHSPVVEDSLEVTATEHLSRGQDSLVCQAAVAVRKNR